MTSPDHPLCLFCALAVRTGLAQLHDDCTGRDGTRWCEHPCDWLT